MATTVTEIDLLDADSCDENFSVLLILSHKQTKDQQEEFKFKRILTCAQKYTNCERQIRYNMYVLVFNR